MNQTRARQIVVTSALLFVVFMVLASIQKDGKLPSMRAWIGYAAGFTGIAFATDLNSPLGPAFAILTTTSGILVYGEDALKFLNKKTVEKVGGDVTPGALTPAPAADPLSHPTDIA